MILHAMRSYVTLAIIFAGFASCSEPEQKLLSPDLVSSIKVYDLDNNGNSSDIRMSFAVGNNLGVFAYRVMIVPQALSNSFTLEAAASISQQRYFGLEPESFQDEYSINRLPAILDVNGNSVINDVWYVVVVLTVGKDDQQLSEFSIPIILKDQPIYSGRYLIQLEGDEPLGVAESNAVGFHTFSTYFFGGYFADITHNGSQYQADVVALASNATTVGENLGKISFTASGQTVTNFVWAWATKPCPDLDFCDLGAPCPLLAEGQGTIPDELIIEVNLSGEDCMGPASHPPLTDNVGLEFYRQFTWIYVRQGS